jgi:hypothetical protein
VSNPAKLLLAGPIARATVPSPVDWRHWLKLSLAKTLGVLSFTPLTKLQAWRKLLISKSVIILARDRF